MQTRPQSSRADRAGGTWRHAVAVVATSVTLLVGVAACGSDDGSGGSSASTSTSTSTSATAPSEAFCAALNQFVASAQAIGGTTAEEIRSSLTTAMSDFDGLKKVSSNVFSGQVDDLDSALTNLQQQLAALGDGGSLADVRSAVRQVTDAASALKQAADCTATG